MLYVTNLPSLVALWLWRHVFSLLCDFPFYLFILFIYSLFKVDKKHRIKYFLTKNCYAVINMLIHVNFPI